MRYGLPGCLQSAENPERAAVAWCEKTKDRTCKGLAFISESVPAGAGERHHASQGQARWRALASIKRRHEIPVFSSRFAFTRESTATVKFRKDVQNARSPKWVKRLMRSRSCEQEDLRKQQTYQNERIVYLGGGFGK
jgi:hypothetical protein